MIGQLGSLSNWGLTVVFYYHREGAYFPSSHIYLSNEIEIGVETNPFT
jgi:hypothetical protein